MAASINGLHSTEKLLQAMATNYMVKSMESWKPPVIRARFKLGAEARCQSPTSSARCIDGDLPKMPFLIAILLLYHPESYSPAYFFA